MPGSARAGALRADHACHEAVKKDRIYLFFAFNYFAQGMSGFVYEPISYILKDRLGLSVGQSAVFVAWMTFPFLIKPLFGILTDLMPIGGARRRPHLALASLLWAGAWLALAARENISYSALLFLLIAVHIGVVASDVICDSVMVEQGRESHKTGLYQAVQIGVLYASLVLTGLGGGWLSAHGTPRGLFALAALLPMMILYSCVWVRESPAPEASRPSWGGLSALLAEKQFWFISALIFLWSFSPFLGTAQFYYQSEALKLSPVFIGFLSTLAGIAGLLGAAFYGRAIERYWNTDTLVKAAVIIGVPLSLLYVFYLGPLSTALLTVLLGFGGVVLRLALMDLAAQACPVHVEATAFAMYMAVFNLAAWASNTVGGQLYGHLLRGFSAYGSLLALTLIGTLATLSCWWLLPRALAYGALRRS